DYYCGSYKSGITYIF
nr:immunoglobulin light chain junction region [Macaca mulatta]